MPPLRLASMLTAIFAAVLIVVALTLGLTNVSADGETCGAALGSVGVGDSLIAVDHGPDCVSALNDRQTIVWALLAAGVVALAGASVLEGHHRNQLRLEAQQLAEQGD